MKSSTRRMRWIIPAVIVAISALIIFQVNWLMREAEMKKEDEKRRISEALRATCIAMEEREARGFIGNSLDSVFVREYLPDHDSIQVKYLNDTVAQVMVIDDHDTNLIVNHRIANPYLPPLPGVPPPPHVAPLSPLSPLPPIDPVPFDDSSGLPVMPPVPPVPPVAPQEWVMLEQHLDSMQQDLDEMNRKLVFKERQRRMKSAMQDVMMEYVFKSGTPGMLDTAVFDSTLAAKLKEEGIEYRFSRSLLMDPYARAVFGANDSVRSKEWEFRAKLYPADPGPMGPEVVLHVEPGNTSVVLRILPQIIFSVLITVGMLVLFLLIYREALKQKKISEIRRDFINNMTHEFKTPLATMSLAADTIMNEKVIGDKDKVKYYAEQIKSENRKLNQQVEKVLELALTEKTGVVMNKEQVNVTELVLRAMKSMQLQVEAKGGTIAMENNPEEILLNADPFHLERVFVNLLDNALKYGGTPPHISVAVEMFRSGTQIRITDNGSGIPQAEWGHIFDPFYRVSTGDVHNVKGFGLGLSYAQSVIKEHNGSISVTSSNGSGTTFTIVLMHELVRGKNGNNGSEQMS